jgi:hypothetical protein
MFITLHMVVSSRNLSFAQPGLKTYFSYGIMVTNFLIHLSPYRFIKKRSKVCKIRILFSNAKGQNIISFAEVLIFNTCEF